MAPLIVVVRPNEFDPSLLVFGPDVRKYDRAPGSFLPVAYKDDGVRKVLLLETPTMPMPFGLSEYEGQKNIDLSFKDAGGDVLDFQHKLETVDKLVLGEVATRQQKLLGTDYNREVLAAFHNRILKEGSKKEYGISMKVKWPRIPEIKDGKDIKANPIEEPAFFDPAYEKAKEEICVPGCSGRVLMELRPVYAVSGKFGVKWTIKQVIVDTLPQKLSECAFSKPPQAIKEPETPLEASAADQEMNDYYEDGQ